MDHGYLPPVPSLDLRSAPTSHQDASWLMGRLFHVVVPGLPPLLVFLAAVHFFALPPLPLVLSLMLQLLSDRPVLEASWSVGRSVGNNGSVGPG